MINRIFSEMQSNVGINVQDTGTVTQGIIKRYINDAYFDVLRRFNWDLKDYDYTINLVAGTQDYALPRDFGKEVYVLDQTNGLNIAPITIQELAEDYPSTMSADGEVGRYTILNKKIISQPTASSVLTLSSSDATDTTQSAFVRGVSGGVEVTETVVLNGTSDVTTTKSYTEIKTLSKSTTTLGAVTVTSNSGAVTQAIISPDVLDYSVKCIRFHNVPSGTITVSIPYIKNPLPLVNDNDVPLISADIIEQGATMHVWRFKRQMAKAQEWERTFEKNIAQLIWDQENSFNDVKQFRVKPYSRNIY